MDRCHGCDGFLPDGLEACPNCDSECRTSAVVRVGQAALAGAALMTLMACYGAPPYWTVSDHSAAPSVQLDADNPSLQSSVEFTINQAALKDSDGHALGTFVEVTPLTPDAEVLVSITPEGGTPHETTVLAGDPVAISVCDTVGDVYISGDCMVTLGQGFIGCTAETCAKRTSITVTLVAGQARVEQSAMVEVEGPDEREPDGSLATVQWLP